MRSVTTFLSYYQTGVSMLIFSKINHQLLGYVAGAALSLLPTLSNADIIKWNVQGARPNFPNTNVSGSFNYDTSQDSILDWNLTANGLFSSQSSFTVPKSHVLQPCTQGCMAPINPLYDGNQVLGFQDYSNASTGFYVGLELPGTSSLLSEDKNINLIGGAQHSYIVVLNPTDVTLGYTQMPIYGSLSYGGSVINGYQGGTSSNPASLATVSSSGIGEINASLGGNYGKSDFYNFYAPSGISATASIAGATSSSTYSFELYSSTGSLISTMILNSSNNFSGALQVSGVGEYTLGVTDNNLADPALKISFSSPVYAAPVPLPAAGWLMLSGLGTLFCKFRRAPKKLIS